MLSPENRSRFTLLSKIALGLFWLALFVGTHIPVQDELLPLENRDKLAHFGAYLTLGFLVATTWQLAGGNLTTTHLVFAWIAVIAYGAIDEITQIPVGRDCDFMDWICDASGAATGLLIFALARRLFFTRPTA
jgi:VanZ family protein